jgi:hypothetical protein
MVNLSWLNELLNEDNAFLVKEEAVCVDNDLFKLSDKFQFKVEFI